MTRKGAGMAASCRAYQSGSSVVARRRARPSSSGSRCPRLLGTHRDVSSTVASTRTSTGWVQPWDRCSSSVDLHDPAGGLAHPVHQAQPPRRRAGLDQLSHQFRAGPRFVCRTRSGDLTEGPDRACHPLRQDPDDLGQRAADQVRGVSRVPVAFQHGHGQTHRLSGGEHQRRKPQATPHPVATLGTADRLDRQIRLPQDRDVAAGSPFCDPKPVSQPVRRDAGVVLDDLQCQQRSRGGAHVVRHALPIPESDRPEPTLA